MRIIVSWCRLCCLALILATGADAAPGSAIAAPEALLSSSEVAAVLSEHARNNRFPNQLEFPGDDGLDATLGHVSYTFDPKVHAAMADVYLKYRPDYACFVALDVDTGAILNLSSFIKNDENWDNLVMRAEYPAASVFKMVTAAAGLDLGKLSPSTVIPFNGKSTTLYKSQVLRHSPNKWTRTPTFKESFAKSVNPVFGQVGVFRLGAHNLTEYAEKFGFDKTLQSDFELPPSRLGLDLDTRWELAEAASGYTSDITISPIHAAQMAAIVANNGKSVVPYMVDSIIASDGQFLYRGGDVESEQIISARAASQLRSLMRETTRIGSARKEFRDLNRYKVYRGMEIGGKTGSLTGFSPRGRHDWFVGYAERDGKRVAFASLIINKEKWYVRSAYVARQFIYNYFSEIDRQQVALAAGN